MIDFKERFDSLKKSAGISDRSTYISKGDALEKYVVSDKYPLLSDRNRIGQWQIFTNIYGYYECVFSKFGDISDILDEFLDYVFSNKIKTHFFFQKREVDSLNDYTIDKKHNMICFDSKYTISWKNPFNRSIVEKESPEKDMECCRLLPVFVESKKYDFHEISEGIYEISMKAIGE